MSGQYIEKEAAKNKIIQQFMTPGSDIHYLMSSLYNPNSYCSAGLFSIPEFCMTMTVNRIEGTNKFQLSFEEFDKEGFETIANQYINISEHDISELPNHIYERIRVTDAGLQFQCVEYTLTQTNYEFSRKLLTQNDSGAFEFDPINRVYIGHQFSGIAEFLYSCKGIERDYEKVYHHFEYSDEMLEKIKQSKWIDKMQSDDRNNFLSLFSKKGVQEEKWYFKTLLEGFVYFKNPLTGIFKPYSLKRKTQAECAMVVD